MITRSASITTHSQVRPLLAAILLGIVALCGCDRENGIDLDGDTSTMLIDGSSPGSTDIDSYCNDSAEQICTLCRDCYQIEYGACFESIRDECFESSNNTLKNGSVFDDSAMKKCLELGRDFYDGCEYPSADSPEFQRTTTVCQEIFRQSEPVQNLNENSECGDQIAGRCANDLFCDIRNQPARCVPLRMLGFACEDGSQCWSKLCRQGLCIQLPLKEICERLISE